MSDTGTGMSDRVLSHIFEPFFSTKGPQAGSGLGLATVYGIAKQSHGYVSVHSEEGKGSKFDLYFPRVEGKPEDALTADVDSMRLRGSETVLVVEDERSVREFAAAILENFGYNVLKAQ
ncbi:MAG: ATP-binding protein, partial [Verrucomicrobia bacterium]|nr:ATP-binding protein [Verrucomicrobiota bacterium]